MTILGPHNWPAGTPPEVMAWLGRVRCKPMLGGDMWLQVPPFVAFNQRYKTFMLTEEFALELPPIDPATSNKLVALNAGWLTDMASIPELLSLLAGQRAEPKNWASCGCGHDPLYDAELVPRLVADECLYWLKIANGETAQEAEEFKLAVNVGGEAVWAAHTPATIKRARQFAKLTDKP